MKIYRLKGTGKIYISNTVGYGTINGKNIMDLISESVGSDDDFYGEIDVTITRYDESIQIFKDGEEEACAE